MAAYLNADYFQSYQYNRSQLGDFYQRQWPELQPKEVVWLNKFTAPLSPFLQLDPARDATVRLYLAVMPALERHSKEAGSTLPKDVKALESFAKETAYFLPWHQRSHSRGLAGHKAGAAVYYTIFERCENAVRARFDVEEQPDSYFTHLADADESFDTYFGERLQELLPPLAAAIPPPDAATEIAINQFETTRWEPRYEKLRALLPAAPASFAEAVSALGRQNERNPVIGSMYLEAARLLGELHLLPEQVVRFYFHYLYYGGKYRYSFKPKPLLKRIQKKLFSTTEQLTRFENLYRELLRTGNLALSSDEIPSIWQRERRKIQLSATAIRAARQQHVGTVELLNEYLQDEPAAPAAAIAPKPPGATKAARRPQPTPAAPVETAAPKPPRAAEATRRPKPAPAAAAPFAASLGLTAAQQALLALFATRNLALPQAEVEALATAHGALRNQLIDGLNEACYALLDDVLIEESADGYTIYEGYYQQLTASC